MFGVTVNFIYNFQVYTHNINRGKFGEEKDALILHNVLRSKIFENEDDAVKWIIEVIPFKDAIPYELTENQNISLKQCIKKLRSFWNEEFNKDRYNYHNSQIIVFGLENEDDVILEEDEDEEDKEDEDDEEDDEEDEE